MSIAKNSHSSAKTVLVDAVTISNHKLIVNGKKVKFSVSSSAFATGNVLDVDNVVKKASAYV